MKQKIALFGSSGGIGQKLQEYLKDYDVYLLNSKNLDITSLEQVEDFFNKNDIDIVLNFSCFNYDGMLHKYTKENHDSLQKQISVNIIGTTNIVSSALKQMRKKKYGRIILASSIMANKPFMGTAIYSASKNYIESLTKTCCIENASLGITCNALQLGYFDAGLTYKINEELLPTIINNIPAKRLGTVEEIYNLIDCIIKTPYINGTSIQINGGL